MFYKRTGRTSCVINKKKNEGLRDKFRLFVFSPLRRVGGGGSEAFGQVLTFTCI